MSARLQQNTSGEKCFPLPESLFIPGFLRRPLERILCLDRAERDCLALRSAPGLEAGLSPLLRARGIDPAVARQPTVALPAKGPLLITSNHPTGILDGTLLMSALLNHRNDVFVVANRMLKKVPHLAPHLIPVEKSGGRSAALQTLRQIRKAWQANACVVLFPSGTVAHWQFAVRAVADAPASESVPRLAAKQNIPHFRARLFLENPLWFHCAGAFSRLARTALLMRAFYTGPRVLQMPPLRFDPVGLDRPLSKPCMPVSRTADIAETTTR